MGRRFSCKGKFEKKAYVIKRESIGELRIEDKKKKSFIQIVGAQGLVPLFKGDEVKAELGKEEEDAKNQQKKKNEK